MGKELLKAVIALQVAVGQRKWDEVEKETDNLTEIILGDCTKQPIIERVYTPSFSAGTTRYAGNSGFSGGCILATA